MATATTTKISVSAMLNMGSTSTGSVKTKSVRIGGTSQNIDTNAYNTDLESSRTKAITIANALSPCLTRTVYSIKETTEADLTN